MTSSSTRSSTNLLENSIRYAGDGVTVRIRARRVDDRIVRLVVEDAGPGVPDGELEAIFEKFWRSASSPVRGRRGTGVGLTVVRRLAEQMGGRASARRSELGGLAIDVDLPIASVEIEST